MRYAFGEFELDEERLELRRGGVKVPAQPKTLDLLLHVIRHRDRVVFKQELLDTVWPGITVTEAAMWRAIMRARTAIGDDDQRALATVRGRGLRFVAEVVEREAAPGAPSERATPAAADPTFVGRTAAVAACEARLDEAFAGRGSAVWITGVTGIGKTRLAAEVSRRARTRGARVVAARTHEGVSQPAFWIWSQVARALVADGLDGAAREALARAASALADRVDGPSSELVVFDAFSRGLVGASLAAPTVLALDDLQWADEGSLRLLRFVVRELAAAAVLVVGTLRDPLPEDDARTRSLAEALREHTSHLVPLRGFAIDEVARLVELTTGHAPSPGLAHELLDRSGGNPFYVQRLVKSERVERALGEAAASLATTLEVEQSLAEALARQIDALSPSTRGLLALAAILGREFDTLRLVAVSRRPRAEVLDAVDEARRLRLIASSGPQAFRFDPLLVRDVIHARLRGTERAALHLQAAERLSEHYGDAQELHAAELARHLTRALPEGDPLRALELAVRAATHEASRGAHRRAAKLWGLAMQALPHVRGERGRLIEVQLGLARAHEGAGKPDAAREGFLDAAMVARTMGASEALAEAALGVAEVASSGRDRAVARRLLADALASLPPGPPSAGARVRVEAAQRALRRTGDAPDDVEPA